MPFDYSRNAPQRIAVIGAGISGLSAAWALSSHHDVTVFEAEARFGGHARTVVAGKNGDQPVDTGFIVFNYVNYPHLTRLFQDLDVPVMRSDMSFGVSLGGGKLEYALRSGDALFGQRRNLFDPRFHGMIRDILRFNAKAPAHAAAHPDLTIEGLVADLGLGAAFRDNYLFPLCGAIWSTSRHGIGAFPAAALVRFMRNHGLMQVKGHHGWWTVKGGSREYVSRLVAGLQARGVRLQSGAPVRSVTRSGGGVSIRCHGGTDMPFDQVVFACHADQALALMTDADAQERLHLGAIRFQNNRTLLHADPTVMPLRRKCWSSWVYRDADHASHVGISYWMNRLQAIPEEDPLFVTLNPADHIRDDLIYDEVTFRHPIFDSAALAAQEAIAKLQGQRNTWFAGAWLRNGFHEDGIASAMRIARQLAVTRVVA